MRNSEDAIKDYLLSLGRVGGRHCRFHGRADAENLKESVQPGDTMDAFSIKWGKAGAVLEIHVEVCQWILHKP